MTGIDEREQIRQRKMEELKQSLGSTADLNAPSATVDSPSEPVHITGPDHLKNVVGENQVVLVDFYADWCGPCKMIAPIVTELAAETPATVAKIDIDEHQELARQYQVRGVPTVMLFANGEPVERIVGVRGRNEYEQLIRQYAS